MQQLTFAGLTPIWMNQPVSRTASLTHSCFSGSNNFLYYDMKIPWYEYKFSGGFQWVVVAVDGDVRRDVRVFYRCNALDKRIPDSCCTDGNRRRTSRDVRHLIRLIEIVLNRRVLNSSGYEGHRYVWYAILVQVAVYPD